jgi:hypothetical protein
MDGDARAHLGDPAGVLRLIGEQRGDHQRHRSRVQTAARCRRRGLVVLVAGVGGQAIVRF